MLSKAVEFMVDNTPDIADEFSTRGMSISLALSDEYTRTCQGYTHNVSDIVIQPAVILAKHLCAQGKDVSDMPENTAELHEPMGYAVLYALAHEFRHVQQELDIRGKLPRVNPNAALCTMCAVPMDRQAYAQDPGEADADKYAAMICEKAPTDIIVGLGKYALDWMFGEEADK